MGGHSSKTITPVDYTGLGIQSSAMSLPVPYAGGLCRGSPNLIDMEDFKVDTRHHVSGGKGGAVGKGGGNETYYNATLVLAVCEGPIGGISKTYVNQGFQAGYVAAGFTLFTGTTPQAPWSYMVSKHPTKAQPYQGIAYVAAPNYGLGTSESLPNFSFEIQTPTYNTGYTGEGDADCALETQRFLTDPQCGANFPTARIDATSLLSTPAATTTGDSAYQTYCRAMGWGISPFISSQESAISVVSRWMQITNTAPCWSGYALKFIPFGDQTITANGVTYIPPFTPVFDFTDDDWIQDGDADPFTWTIRDPYDSNNAIAIDCSVRANDYNSVPIDWIDQSTADSPIGRRQAGNISGREICVTAMATQVVSLIGQRMTHIRGSGTGKLGPEHAIREPMEMGYVSSGDMIRQPVLIRSMEEDDNGEITFVFEEFPGTVGQPTTLASGSGGGAAINSEIDPTPVNTPLILEPNSSACAFLNNGSTAALIVAAVSGGAAGVADPNWGGYTVWASTDDTTFTGLAAINGTPTVKGPSRQGVLTASLASYGGANPDSAHTLSVSTAMSDATLQGASSGSDAAAGSTLCVIKDAGGTYELLSAETATLTGADAYDLTNLYRGQFGTAAAAHSSGAQFARLDGSQFMAVLPPAYIGRTLYLKFQSFNIWGNAVQDISTCTVYTYTPTGAGFGGGTGGVPTQVQGLTATPSGSGNVLGWTDNLSTDNVTAYLVYRANGSGASFGSATQIGTAGQNQTSYTDATATPGQAYTYFVAAQNVVGTGTASAGASVATGQPNAPTNAITAGSTLTAGQIVNIYASSGAKVQPADVADDTKPADGFVLANVSSGAAATVYGPGQVITGLGGLTPGATYWLAAAGGVTATLPTSGWVQIVGKALTATTLRFDPQQGFLL